MMSVPASQDGSQVNGSNALFLGKRNSKYDVMAQLKTRALRLDMKIIWITLKKVIKRESISANGEATMPKFTGNKGVIKFETSCYTWS